MKSPEEVTLETEYVKIKEVRHFLFAEFSYVFRHLDLVILCSQGIALRPCLVHLHI